MMTYITVDLARMYSAMLNHAFASFSGFAEVAVTINAIM